jgi:upstream activation factor subunit UAF30
MPSKAKPSTTANKDAPAKTASAKDASAKKVNPALMRPLQPSQALAAVVGSKPLPRPEVVSKVWDYIKTNQLQDPQNKREIMADDKLRAVFGKERVTMFEMNKHLAQHLT